MFRLKFILLVGFVFSLEKLNAQVKFEEVHYTFDTTDYQNCWAESIDLTYPFFYSENGLPLTVVNDSIQKIIGYVDFPVADSIDVNNAIIGDDDSVYLPKCDPLSLMPDGTVVYYEMLLNDKHWLSFELSYSMYAGGGGHGGQVSFYTFSYDLKRKEWINLKSLFRDGFDTLLIQKTDSLFLGESGMDNLNEPNQFSGNVGMKHGNLVFYYYQNFGGKSLDQPVNIPYEEFQKHLNRRYRKMLKPKPAKPISKNPQIH